MKTTIAIVFGFIAVSAYSANVYYADAVNGNEQWDGSCDFAHSVPGELKGPKLYLQSALDSVSATSSESAEGDTVILAAGDYKVGSYLNSDTTYRGFVPNGCSLVGAGKDKTFINGNGEICCLLVGKWTLVKDVTICNGFSETKNAVAVMADNNVGDSYLVGCAVSNHETHVTTAYPGACLNMVPIRCLFAKTKTSATTYGNFLRYGKAFSCVFDTTESSGGGNAIYSTDAYNCTFLGALAADNSADLYNCLFKTSDGRNNVLRTCVGEKALAAKSTTPDNDCELGLGDGALVLDADYTPAKEGKAFGFGDNGHYLTNFPNSVAAVRLVADQKNLDYNGKSRIIGGTIDAGAVEVNSSWYPLDPTAGLNVLAEGQTVSISRNYTSEKLVTGFSFNENVVDFDDYEEGHVFQFGFEGDIGSQVLDIYYAEKMEWYVNPVTGNDGNKGYSKYCAFKTLSALPQEDGTISDWNVFHLAKGVYRELTVEKTVSGSTAGNFRLYIPAYTRVVCDDESGSAVICGAEASADDRDALGNGSDAVRCIKAKDRTSQIYGCAITGGRTISSGTDKVLRSSGAVIGALTMYDCVLTNNAAANEGGVARGQNITAIRCFFDDNRVGGTGGEACSVSFNLFNCVFGTNHDKSVNHLASAPSATYSGAAYNCLFLDGGHHARAYNCVALGSCSVYCATNCLFTDMNDYRMGDPNTCARISDGDVPYDANYRPLPGSKAIDFGDSALYREAILAAGIEDAESSSDYTAGQRVYNSKIDAGPGEYDWRGDFAKKLAKKDVEVAAAGGNVTTNLTTGLDVPAGNSLKLKLIARTSGVCSFKVALEDRATASVTRDGQPLEIGEDGLCTFRVADEGEVEVEVACAGEGQATVSDFVLPKFGLMLIFR